MNDAVRTRPAGCRHPWVWPFLIAGVAASAVLAGIHSETSAPGLTIDEPINVNEAVRLSHGFGGWIRSEYTLEEVFGGKEEQRNLRSPLGLYNPDYPPFGRLLLAANQDVRQFSTQRSRSVSAIAFGLTVFLVGWVTGRWYGLLAGAASSLALVTMPRVFGHAHLANLETLMNLTFAAAVFAVAASWGERPPRPRTAAWTGALFGFALLTKIQAVLIPIPVIAWALIRYRQRAFVPLLAWGMAAGVVFFVGWPWLWLDPVDHMLQYFGQATERVTLKVFYLGAIHADRDTPWHYPFVIFLTTMPVGWLLLGLCGGLSKPTDHADLSRKCLIAGVALFSLTLFALPGVVVYDGARLFLVACPLWAVFIGRGASTALEFAKRRWTPTIAKITLGTVMLAQCIGVVWYRPAYLSYYNAFTGGLWGAEKLGFEPTFWGDSLSPAFLSRVADRVPRGATIHVSPVLHELYLRELQSQSLALRAKGVTLQPYDPERFGRPKFVLFFRRRADLFPELEAGPSGARLVFEMRRQGVLLAGLYDFSESDKSK